MLRSEAAVGGAIRLSTVTVRDLRSLLAELRSQRLDEGHQNLRLDSDLFKHRDVHISFLVLPLA